MTRETKMIQAKKIAVLLCGSGFKDGSEIRESVATLYALSKHQIEFQCFSLNQNQHHVINCKTGEELSNQFRNQLIESARIARGDVFDIKTLSASDYAALIIPGGFGVAKNLCNYAFKGIEGSVQLDVAKILNDFHQNKKPIGAICIAPMLLAMHFKNKNLKLTLGHRSDISDHAERLGHTIYELESHKAIVDQNNLIVSTPAYMNDKAELFQIFEGIEALVVEIAKLY